MAALAVAVAVRSRCCATAPSARWRTSSGAPAGARWHTSNWSGARSIPIRRNPTAMSLPELPKQLEPREPLEPDLANPLNPTTPPDHRKPPEPPGRVEPSQAGEEPPPGALARALAVPLVPLVLAWDAAGAGRGGAGVRASAAAWPPAAGPGCPGGRGRGARGRPSGRPDG